MAEKRDEIDERSVATLRVSTTSWRSAISGRESDRASPCYQERSTGTGPGRDTKGSDYMKKTRRTVLLLSTFAVGVLASFTTSVEAASSNCTFYGDASHTTVVGRY